VLGAADTGKFFGQVSSSASPSLPEGVVGDMGQRIRQKIESGGVSIALFDGIRTFVNSVGEQAKFDFALLDTQNGEVQIAQQQRPRTVQSPVPEPSANPEPTPTATSKATLAVTATPKPTEKVAGNSRPSRTPSNKSSASPAAADPEDEKEEVELVLTLPANQRVDKLKAFIAAHPTSVAVPRAKELIVVAYAMVGDQKMQAGDVSGGLEQFRLAIAEAPLDMNDRLFTDVIARIPLNLFFHGQRDAGNESARLAEALAKGNAKRLLALAEFYINIENAKDAARLAETAIQLAPDSAAAHQALGAARHIDLRLDEAEAEYARALSIDAKP